MTYNVFGGTLNLAELQQLHLDVHVRGLRLGFRFRGMVRVRRADLDHIRTGQSA